MRSTSLGTVLGLCLYNSMAWCINRNLQVMMIRVKIIRHIPKSLSYTGSGPQNALLIFEERSLFLVFLFTRRSTRSCCQFQRVPLGSSLMNQLTLGHGTVSLVSSRFAALYVLGVRDGSTVSSINFLLPLAAIHLSTGDV